MAEVWDVVLDSLIDTAKILPILFAVYYLIELFEFKFAKKFEENKMLKGKCSPIFGALMGCVPQCGFSVVSTDLFANGSISIGALIAVYIATSDEAIPLMLANPSKILWLLLLIGMKIVIGIAVGYLAIGLFKLIFKNSQQTQVAEHTEAHKHGCCHHDVESKSFDWLHPLLHCLKISAFILVINLLFGLITNIWIGEEAMSNFLQTSKYAQPCLAVLIGLIPNCASSVVLTELFISNGLAFSALLAGLCANAGLGLIVLFKENKNIKINLFIVGVITIVSIAIGYAFIWI